MEHTERAVSYTHLDVYKRQPYGSYTIRELSAPHGYHPSEKVWKVDIDGTFVNPIKVLDTVENQPAPGRIKILKQDELDKHCLLYTSQRSAAFQRRTAYHFFCGTACK